MPYSVSLTTGNTLNPDPQLGNFGKTIEEKKGGGDRNRIPYFKVFQYIRRSAAALHQLEPFGAKWHVLGTLICIARNPHAVYRHAWDCKAIRGLVALKIERGRQSLGIRTPASSGGLKRSTRMTAGAKEN
jgi:hypothetical protein